MSERLAAGGLAARLLDRAEGRVAALRPSLPPTFAAEQAQGEPMLETTEEAPSRSPAAPPAGSAVSGESRETAVSPAPAPRLMPPVVPLEAPQTAPAAPDPVAALEAAAVEMLAPVAAGAPSQSERVTEPRLVPARPQPVRPQGPDNLAAAVMQLLNPTPPGAGEPGAQPIAPLFEPTARRGEQRESFGEKVPVDPAPVDRSAGGVTIHIGEIVVAPEPRAPPRESGAHPAWQPPLSLSEYRASRARERR